MLKPTSTYRLQLRNGMTFARAGTLIDYWKNLGISHLYLSPICTATHGSTHGYDVADAMDIEPEIGGREGFKALATALKAAGIGIILDIVPNHMAASLENPWWHDVLEQGPASAFARYFDIDWRERLTLPVLGQTFEEALDAGEFRLVRDEATGAFGFGYYENVFPLNAEGGRLIRARMGHGGEGALADVSSHRDLLRQMHDVQHWVLLPWQEAASHLSYRRFFEVTGLVGLRVEDPEVYNAVHRLPLELVRSGLVQGLRIDHIDGLADPTGYLQRLRQDIGPDRFLVVEKILAENEKLPEIWPVAGTTGYEFIAALPHLFVKGDGLQVLDQAYRLLADAEGDFPTVLADAKAMMVERNFAGEVSRLTRLATEIGDSFSGDELADAIRAMLMTFPVYRTYGTDGGLSDQDLEIVSQVVAEAETKAASVFAVRFVAQMLRGEIGAPAALEFRSRFQQLTGPVMAKAMEDTSFYRHNRLIALNEVGGEPLVEPGGPKAFHALMQQRLAEQPHGLSATSTHDTKRGEDARARLYALSEAPQQWCLAVGRWREMNSRYRIEIAGELAPEPNIEWLIYQALLGAWPEGDAPDLGDLSERMVAYIEKAVREAKLRTDWSAQDADYEAAVTEYVKALLAPENRGFIEDFSRTIAPLLAAGRVNSLSQTLVKLTAPGIPDIYQGSEAVDCSLVDPDNRRVPDFDRLQGDLVAERPSGTALLAVEKQRIIASVLAYRLRHRDLFGEGSYFPLDVTGPRCDHVLAFARQKGAMFAITIVPRLLLGHVSAEGFFADEGFWLDTHVLLPPSLQAPITDVVTGERFAEGDRLALSELLGSRAVRLLVADT